MNTTVEVINQLRIETSAEVMECRKALEQGNQNKDEH
jgi:translation elongation factor EF-Ts